MLTYQGIFVIDQLQWVHMHYMEVVINETWVPYWTRYLKGQLPAYIDGVVQEKHNSSALAMELHLAFTHWGWLTHICVSTLTIIGSDNGLSLERRQAIIWTNARILLVGPLRTNFSEILIEIQAFSLTKIRLKMLSPKCCSFRLSFNVLTHRYILWTLFGDNLPGQRHS